VKRFFALLFASPIVLFFECGAEVDLGGNGDGGAPCDLCASSGDCRTGEVCTLIKGNGFCTTLCVENGPCATTETCSDVTTANGSPTRACLPSKIGRAHV